MLRLPASNSTRTAPLLLVALLTLAACSDGAGDDAAVAAQEASRTTAASTEPRPMIGTAWVIFGTDTVVAEVARSNEERAQGLMYREEVPDGTGMLFVFPDLAVRSFWMQNTYVALDIAYMAADMRIINIEPLEPESTTSVPSNAPAQYALEVRQGWFAEKGIEAGTVPRIIFP